MMNLTSKKTKRGKVVPKVMQFALVAGLVGAVGLANAETVHGHGYVEAPASRSVRANRAKEFMGWNAAFQRYGHAIDDPHSIEGPGSTQNSFNLNWWQTNRPADGQFASGGVVGQSHLDFSKLDIQTEAHWKQTGREYVNPGINDFTWFFTMGHATNQFKYFITKEGWDPNTEITNDDLELIEVINLRGEAFGSNARLTHQVDIPANRSGYHVVLAVWDVSDTNHAFYQAIDIYVTNDEVEPTPPPNPDDNPDLECCPEEPNPEQPDPEQPDPEQPDPEQPNPEIPAGVNAFDSLRNYQGGEIVAYQGNLYRAQWTTLGGSPATSIAWEQIETVYEDGSIDFRTTSIYFAGNIVRYEGNLYRAQWWTQGGTPATSSVWQLIGAVQD